MKYLVHPVNIPRKLSLRYEKPVANSTKAWESFKGKTAVQNSLLPAQKHLCSYCEINLARGETELGYHIEHIELKSINPNRTFDFSNLLISCFDSGYEISPSTLDPNPISCGHSHAKKNEFDSWLFIKPTDQNCESYFYYELDGRITPHSNLTVDQVSKAEYTIDLLNLNCRRLKRARRDMISEGFEFINNFLGDPNVLSDFSKLELEEINNKHRSFFTTRRQYFQEFIITQPM